MKKMRILNICIIIPVKKLFGGEQKHILSLIGHQKVLGKRDGSHRVTLKLL